MKIIPLALVVMCVVCGGVARAQDDEIKPAVTRGLLKRGLLAKGKATTTTTTPAPQEDADYEYETDEAAEGDQQVSSTEAPSSTEGKKLVAGGVRPFRSNADLLETLKRRRAQVAEAKIHGSTTAAPQDTQYHSEAPAKSSYSNKKRYTTAIRETNNEDAPPPPPKPSKGRFGGRPAAAKSIQEDQPEEVQDVPAPPARNGRAFNRRGN